MGFFARMLSKSSSEPDVVRRPTQRVQRPLNQSGQNGNPVIADSLPKNTIPGEKAVTTFDGKQVVGAISDMPPVRGLLTATNSTNPGLRVPKEIQDDLIAVKTGATHARIYFEPKRVGEVAKFFASIHTALTEAGLSAGGTEYPASSDIIRQVRLSFESAGAQRGATLGQGSAGASMFRDWVKAAHKEGATDVHLRILDGGKGEVMMRVDGSLEPIPESDNGIFTERDVLQAIKAAYEVLSDRHSNNQGAFSETTTLSSMIDAALGISNLRLRFSSVRGLAGPKAVVRLLPNQPGSAPMSFADMGFAPSHIAIFDRAHRLQAGAIGQMGVTGSGKTTAAKTFVETHPGYGSMAMYQVADPIEYPMDRLHQIYVQRSLISLADSGKKDPYTEAIESLMRSDPDFVDVGEVRDSLSARAMANVAKSGHMSLFTLHVDSLAGVLNRLTDPNIGLSRSELTTSNLLGMLCYQALSPKLCPFCKLDHQQIQLSLMGVKSMRSEQELSYIRWLLDILEKKFGFPPEAFRFRNPTGCEHCRKRGTKGLTICAEMLMPEAGWLDLSAQGKDREAIQWWRNTYSDRDLSSPNMDGKLVCEHAMFKAAQGLIDPREIERFVQLQALEVLKK